MSDQNPLSGTKITVNDPLTRSADLVGENLEKLKALLPDAFTEGKVDFDVLKQLLGGAVEEREERYGLNWHGKRLARQIALTPSTGTLRPCPEESVDWDSTQNLMIEGDNLEVLKLLQKSYAGKVKLIYIDPPYNTGKDFVYPDNFKDSIKNYHEITGDGSKVRSNPETSGRYHTDWLNMMYPRLWLARSMLHQSGFLVISIDDSEVANLRASCDEIFGAENFIANVVWQKKYTRANDAKFFSDNHDHLLVYSKDISMATLGRVERGEEQLAAYGNPDRHNKGEWKSTPLHARSGSNVESYTFSNGVKWTPPPGTFRRFSDESMAAMDAGGEIWFGADGSQVPSRKSFLAEMDDGMVPVTIWDHKFAGHNHEANSELKDIDMAATFTSPKPTRLIRRLLDLCTSNDSCELVLDFFAGSGTSGHAVLARNAANGGAVGLKYILVQLPEPVQGALFNGYRTIAEITKERLRRAGAKIRSENPLFKGDTGFRVFKLDSSNIRAWDPNRDALAESLFDHTEHLVPGRTEQDVLFELLLKLGLDLSVPIVTRTLAGKAVHSIGAGALMVSLADGLDRATVDELARGILAWRAELAPAVSTSFVFKDSGFTDDVAKSNLVETLRQGLDPAVIDSIRSI